MLSQAAHTPVVGETPILRQLSALDRYLPVWIFAAMAIGSLVGRVYPDLGATLDRVQL